MNKYGAKQVATSNVATSTTPGTLLAARTTRIQAILKNIDDTDSVYVSSSVSDPSADGLPLAPGESMTVTALKALYYEASDNTPAVRIYEEFN